MNYCFKNVNKRIMHFYILLRSKNTCFPSVSPGTQRGPPQNAFLLRDITISDNILN